MADAGERFARLVEVMRTLRAPGGCPWDREQTHRTIAPYLLEETYEVLDAIEKADAAALREEIGDLLYEAVFLAQVSADRQDFDVADALDTIVDKLIRRHPHVFARASADGAPPDKEVAGRWEELKAAERARAGQPRSVLDGLPRTLPALLHAYKIGGRVAAVGFDWPHARDVVAKIEEEATELGAALAERGPDERARAEEELGDLLFALANLSRKLGIEPEAALRKANDKFTTRFRALESALEARGVKASELTLDALEEAWQKIKAGA